MTSDLNSLAFRVRMARQMAERAKELVRSHIGSKTLRRTLEARVEVQDGVVTGVVHSPFYWAEYYHDGRGPVRAKPGKWLVYFRNTEEDPRINGGRNYPRKREDIRRLTKGEFRKFLAQGALVVRKSVKGAPAHPFFETGTRGVPAEAGRIIPPAFADLVRRELGELLDLSGTVTL